MGYEVSYFFLLSQTNFKGDSTKVCTLSNQKNVPENSKMAKRIYEGGGEGGGGEIPSASAIGLPIKKKQNTQNKTCIIFALRVSRSRENKYLSCISLQFPFSSCNTILQFQLWFQVVCSPCN